MKNKIEGINRSRGEAGETIHHLFMGKLKGYISDAIYKTYRERYKQCIRMLNGLEKSIEQHLSEKERRWGVAEVRDEYSAKTGVLPSGFPNTEH